MKIVDRYIYNGDILIRENNIEELNNIYKSLLEELPQFDLSYLFQKLFLKACLYGNKNTINWFINIYNNEMNDISKIGIRHTLTYGKYLIKKRKDDKNNKLYNWYITIKF